MKKNLIVKQEYSKECGSACLLSIIRYYGGNVSMNRLVELTKTGKEGTNFYNMAIASSELGLASRCYKIEELNHLFSIDRPFITQVISNNFTHFVVIYKVNRDKIMIMDPGYGKVIMDIKSFLDIWTGYVMLFEPYRKLPIIKDVNYLGNLIVKVILDNKKLILNILLLSIIFTVMTCIYSFYLNVIVDYVVSGNYANLLIISVIFSVVIMVKYLADYSRCELLLYINQKLDLSIIINTFNKILLLPYNYYKNKTTGDVISRINDLVCVKTLLSKIIIIVFLDLLIMIVASLILINISFKMFLGLVVIILIYLVIFKLFRGIIIKYTNINQENNAKLNSFFVENISGFETIKGLHIESIIRDKFSKLYSNSLEDNMFYNRAGNLEVFFKNIVSGLGIVIIIYLGVLEVKSGSMSLGLLITFYSLASYFLEPIKGIIDLSSDYYYVKNAFFRMNSLLEVDSIKFLTDNLKVEGDISIRNLCFSYNNYKNILDNVSVNIKNKEKVLVLGSSGSGKSTLLKILYKYYDINRDKVSIGSYDLNDFSLGTIRDNVCYISQDERLYTGTIKDNILLDRNIEYDNFIDVCMDTYVDDIVEDKFLGYDMVLEENGSNISGGQRQRIVLARSLLKNSKILLIDEGFSEIDINMERKILKNIFKNYNDKTIIIVSHRLDNMDLYDKVIKMDNGKIIDVMLRK